MLLPTSDPVLSTDKQGVDGGWFVVDVGLTIFISSCYPEFTGYTLFQVIFIRIAPGGDHESVVGKGVAIADKHGREHIDIGFVKVGESGDHNRLIFAHGIGDNAYRGLPRAVFENDLLGFV